MQVSFNVKLRHVKTIKAIMEYANKRVIDAQPYGEREDHRVVACGNLNIQYKHLNWNQNQWLHFDEKKSLIVYKGERHPMQQDSALRTLEEIFEGKDYHNWEVVEYVTSDPRLKWYETLYQYISNRAPLAEVLEYLTLKEMYHVQLEPLVVRLGVTEVYKDILVGKCDSILATIHEADVVRQVRMLIAKLTPPARQLGYIKFFL